MITAHTIVRNEENWIWYAVQSVLPFVERHLIFDTGSADRTLEVLKTVHSRKLMLVNQGIQDRQGLVNLRNEMLEQSQTDWFLLVDGDEIWPTTAIRRLVNMTKKASNNTWGIVVRTRNCVGDVWHYQPEIAGRYNLLGRTGHFSIRAYRKLPGFAWKGEYPLEAYCDPAGRPINEQDEHLKFLDVAYWHVTHLKRSSRSSGVIDRKKKQKLETGIRVDKGDLPHVFFLKRPNIVPSPWIYPSLTQRIQTVLITPLRTINRRIRR